MQTIAPVKWTIKRLLSNTAETIDRIICKHTNSNRRRLLTLTSNSDFLAVLPHPSSVAGSHRHGIGISWVQLRDDKTGSVGLYDSGQIVCISLPDSLDGPVLDQVGADL